MEARAVRSDVLDRSSYAGGVSLKVSSKGMVWPKGLAGPKGVAWPKSVAGRLRASAVALLSGLGGGLFCALGTGRAAGQAQTPTGPPPAVVPALPPMPLPAMGVPGSVRGKVIDTNGDLMQGARVLLQESDGRPSHVATSDRDGVFSFTNVPPGPFALRISLGGFEPVSLSATLPPNGRLTLSVPALKLAVLNVTVDAVATEDELGTEQMVAEEHQRLLGVLPNFFVSYHWTAPALTTRQKFSLSTHNAADPGNLLLVGTTAGVQQATNAFPGYHQGATGYGKRYGADLANLVVGTYMGGAVLPSLFHQDPRYFYKGTGSVRSRFFYAVSTAFVCRGDNGHRQPAFAGMLGDLSAGAISNLYYARSDRQGAGLTFENGFLAIAGDAMNNVVQEFFLKKITSKK